MLRLMQRILILCTGNSCRSIMAEGLFNQLGQGRVVAVSAGSRPTGQVHPQSLAVLQAHGIDINGYRSKSWDEFSGAPFDYVITVCDQAVAESCPVFLGSAKKVHWSTPDPAKATGSAAEIDAAFMQAFNFLQQNIAAFLRGDVK
jgi:arsenate reductase (thioredoxin)